MVTRAFDSHSSQANFGLGRIKSKWVLSLDADYILTPEFQQALQKDEIPTTEDNVYFAPFLFRVHGRPLRASLMPPRAVLYTRQGAVYYQDGHTQRLSTAGRRSILLTCALIHDDRKPLSRWLDSQKKYALLEAEKLKSTPLQEMAAPDRLRRLGWVAPWVIFPYVLLVRGLIFDGWPGWVYAFQRVYAELLLSLCVLDEKLRRLSN